jgi:hypothetical protein
MVRQIPSSIRRAWWTVFDPYKSAFGWSVLPATLILGYWLSVWSGHATSVWYLLLPLGLLPFGIWRTRSRLGRLRGEGNARRT